MMNHKGHTKERKIIKQTIENLAQELAKRGTMPILELKKRIEQNGIRCSTKSLINNIAAVASGYAVKGDIETAKRVINSFTIGLKELWITNCVWEAKDKKPLQEYIWRDLVPYDIIERIDFESLVEIKKKLLKGCEDREGEIRILKTVFQNDKQYDLIIDVKDPRYDWWGDSYQFFIRFTDNVNQIPLIYENLCIKVVIPCVKHSDILNKYGITTLMVFEPNRGKRRGGLFSDKVTNYFTELLFENDERTPFNSYVLKKILFNYLVFVEIGKFSNQDSYTVGCNNGKYYIYWKSEYIYACVIDRNETLNVVDAATELLSIGELPSNSKLVVVYLEDVSNSKSPDYVFNGNVVSVISIEAYYNEKSFTEELKFKFKEQVAYLKTLNDNNLIDYSDEKDADRWDVLSTLKLEQDFVREVNADTIIEKNGKWFAKRHKKVFNKYKHSKPNTVWVGPKWYITDDEELVAVQGQPEDFPSQVGRKLCHFDPKVIAKADKTPLYDSGFKNIIIEPENAKTICHIDKSVFDDAVKFFENGISNIADKNEWFRFLCAANLVNAYKKYYDKSVKINTNGFVCQLVFRYLQCNDVCSNSIITAQYSDRKDVSLMVSIVINNRQFQFYFRGIEQKDFDILKALKVSRGNWLGIKLQPIASLLYKYSLSL